MQFISLSIGNLLGMDIWYFRLVYQDKDGYRVIITKEDFQNKDLAEAHAQMKRNEIEITNWTALYWANHL